MIRRLVEKNDAMFLATGAQNPRATDLPGRHLAGIFDGLSYLSRLNSSQLGSPAFRPDMGGKRVLILGGGDTAIDCARSAVRQSASSVIVAYRRGPEQMRASSKEVAAAREEGVGFAFHKKPLAFVGKEQIEGIAFASGNGGADEVLACEAAIIAFGQEAAKPDWLKFLGIATDERGFIKVDENGRTSHPKVFAGGDNTHGPDLVVTAIAAGRRASRAILSACRQKSPTTGSEVTVS
jgi:glutamate synthase (NADPH/NADH) small chain